MPQWGTFAGVTVVVLLLLLALTRLTQRAFSDVEAGRSHDAEAGRSYDGDPTSPDDGDSKRLDDDSSKTLDDGGPKPRADAPPDSTDRASETGVEGPNAIDADRAARSNEEAGCAGDVADRPPEDGTGRRGAEATPVAGGDGEPSPREMADADSRVRGPESTAEPRGPVERADRIDPDGPRRSPTGAEFDPSDLSTGALLANVALSQGLFGAVLVGAAIYAGIPADALGIEFGRSYLVTGLFVGTAAGIVLYVANEIGAASATRFGFDHDERLRGLLAPEGLSGWVVLLVGVLPVIAVFEELLFRAALIGAFAAGFGLSPWLLALLSSVAFGLGHGMQGTVGVAVTAALGFVLAATFVLTGSLLVVVVAHYLINAFEFVVHEGFGFDWATALESQD